MPANRTCLLRLLLLAGAMLVCSAGFAKSAYRPLGTCDGLPRIQVTTLPGFCVGIVAEGFRFPRGVLPLANGDLLVSDLGGWVEKRGAIWYLKKTAVGYRKTRILQKLDRPHGIALGPDGLVYVGLVGRIVRFDLRDPAGTLTDVIGGKSHVASLPGTGRHPLTTFVFDRHGNLFVNVGSQTDHCERTDDMAPDPKQACPETEGGNPRGVIRKYTMQWPAGTVQGWENYARGLRNSMALAFQPGSDVLWQGENSRDAIQRALPGLVNDNELPHDELNRIERGASFGWPTCFDDNLPSPEYPQTDCSAYRQPARLLPAHAAPLGMVFYEGKQFPAAFHNSLIMSFHGYRQHGHRIVALMPDKNGAPLGAMIDLVSGWEATDEQPMGAPVDVRLGADGALYLAEDRNGTVLSLRYTGMGKK